MGIKLRLTVSNWSLSENPFTLMHWCRLVIRKQLGVSRLKDVGELKLPHRLALYMEHKI